MFKNLPSIAGDVGSIPDQVIKISRNSGQLRPSTTTRDALVPLRKSPCTTTKTQRSSPHQKGKKEGRLIHSVLKY